MIILTKEKLNIDTILNQAENDFKIIKLNSKLFHPFRILIMKSMIKHIAVEFSDLKRGLTMSDGNLASHLRALLKEGLIEKQVDLDDQENRVVFYGISLRGKSEFNKFSKIMVEVLQ